MEVVVVSRQTVHRVRGMGWHPGPKPKQGQKPTGVWGKERGSQSAQSRACSVREAPAVHLTFSKGRRLKEMLQLGSQTWSQLPSCVRVCISKGGCTCPWGTHSGFPEGIVSLPPTQKHNIKPGGIFPSS